MLDSLLLKIVNNHSDSKLLDAMQADSFERPDFYSPWIAPLRYLLTLRYLKHKTVVIASFTEQGIYPVHPSEYIQALQARLNQRTWFGWLKHPDYWFSPLSSIVFYPIIITALIFGSWHLHQWHMTKKMEIALADRLPYYSELVHRAQVAQQNFQLDDMKAILQQASHERETIISHVPDKGDVRDKLSSAMDSLLYKEKPNSDIMVAFKKLNVALDKQKLPFYISPKLFQVACSSLVGKARAAKTEMFNNLKDMFKDPNQVKNIPLCSTGIITVYNVTDRRGLDYIQTADKEELPLFHVTRADRVPAADGALGLTFKNQGIGSIILLDQIKRFAEQSVLPAITFQGRGFIIPYWLQGYYDIEESITQNYKSDLAELFSDAESLRLLREAAKEMLLDQQHLSASRMQQTLQRSTPGNQALTGVLGGSLDALSAFMATTDEANKPAQTAAKVEIEALIDSLLPSIEYHEAYHQIVKDDWVEPSWVPEQFEKLTKQGIESSLEELGAYLTQLVYTDTGHKIWLTKLLLFSLNSMTQGQPEYYASSIIFSAMRDQYLMKDIKANYDLSVEEKVDIYKALSTYSSAELNQLAEKAFEELFDRPVVTLE